jgi:hypothetical protein
MDLYFTVFNGGDFKAKALGNKFDLDMVSFLFV